MTKSIEEWRPVVGHEGAYEVSSLGRIRSLPREVPAGQRGGTRLISGRVLVTSIGRNGYRQVTLRKRTHMVHTLVARSFIGERPEGYEVCHNDGDSDNNAATNLRYDTVSANRRDTVNHGNHRMTQRTHCPKNHPYDEANTGYQRGARRCLTCHRESERTRNERNRHAQAV